MMKRQYKFPDIEMNKQMAQDILSGKIPVLLYGMGAAAADKILDLRNQGVKIAFGLDQNSKLWDTEILGVSICSPMKFTGTDQPVIICSESYYYEICIQLRQLGFKNIFPYFFYHSGNNYTYQDFRHISSDANKVILFNDAIRRETYNIVTFDGVDLPITEKCSLRCKDCSNLMQYFEKPQDESFEKCLNAIDNFTNVIDAVNEIRVLGGEPFLSKDFSKYMEHLCTIPNVGTVVVYTNATIIPKNELLHCLKHPKVTVRMSDYGSVSRNLDKLISLFEAEEIFYSVVAYSEWTDCTGFLFQNREPFQLEDAYSNCCVRGVVTLKNGVLFGCPYAANAAALRAIPSDADEFVDVYNLEAKQLRMELKNFKQKKYLKACNYCKGRPKGVYDIPAAIQVPQVIPYKKFV